jgi:predicted sugar kinase
LARASGRSFRSGIGLFGIAGGGLLIDAGRGEPGGLPTFVGRWSFPERWRVVLLRPTESPAVSGAVEQRCFDRLGDRADAPETIAIGDRMSALLLRLALPALAERDLSAFGEALAEYNRLAGELFAPVQGGQRSHGDGERWLERMGQAGLVGCGQSSWGPTLFGFAVDDDAARGVAERLGRWLPSERVRITRAARTGALVNGASMFATSEGARR